MIIFKKLKNIMALIIIGIILICNTYDFCYAVNYNASNISVGSPLLDENWNSEDGKIPVEDLYAMAIFMSNYVDPFIDNYQTAFGSEDAPSYEIISKLSTSEIINNRVREVAEQIISYQLNVSNNRPIYKINKGEESNQYITNDDRRATLKDFIEDNLEFDFYSYYNDSSGNRQPLPVYKHDENCDESGFSLSLLRSIKTRDRRSKIDQLLRSNYNSPIELDGCGNIVVKDGREYEGLPLKNTIILPAVNNVRFWNGHVNLICNSIASGLSKESNSLYSFIPNSSTITNQTKFNEYTGKTRIDFSGYTSRNFIEWLHGSAKQLYNLLNDNRFINSLTISKDKVINDYVPSVGMSDERVPLLCEYSQQYKKFEYNSAVVSALKDTSLSLNAANQTTNLVLYYNYLLNVSDKDKITDEYKLINKDFFNLSALFNITFTNLESEKEADERAKKNIRNIINQPENLSSFTGKVISQGLVDLYEGIINLSETGALKNDGLFSLPTANKGALGLIFNLINNNLPLIASLLIIGAMIFGFIKGTGLKTFKNGIYAIFAILALQGAMNFIIAGTNDLINAGFKPNISTWILQEQMDWESKSQQASMDASEDASLYYQLYNEFAFDNGNFMSYAIQKSPVINNNSTTEVMNILSRSYVGQLFLSNILHQRLNSDNNVETPMIDLCKRWIFSLCNMDDETFRTYFVQNQNYFNKIGQQKVNDNDLKKLLTQDEIQVKYKGYTNTTHDYSNAKWSSIASRLRNQDLSDTEYGIAFYNSEENEENSNEQNETSVYSGVISSIDKIFNIHRSFYLLDDLKIQPSSTSKYEFDMQDITNSEISSLESNYEKYFKDNKLDTKSDSILIPKFRFLDESRKIGKDYGYFILTENVSPYFYAVFNDIFGSLKKQDIFYQIQGQVEYEKDNNGNPDINRPIYDEDGNYIRDSILVYKNKSRDYLDLEELFKNVVPYMHRVHQIAKTSNTLNNTLIDEDYATYKNLNREWLYSSKWASLLMKMYGEQIKDAEVFSEAEKYYGNNEATVLNTTMFENLIIEFYSKLTPQLEHVIDFANYESVNRDIIIRYMTILATLQFNKTFSGFMNKLEPTTLNLGGLNTNTVYNQLLSTCYVYVRNQKSAAYNLNTAQGSFPTFFLLIVAFIYSFLIPIIRVVLLFAFVICFFFALAQSLQISMQNFEGAETNGFCLFIGGLFGLIKIICFTAVPSIVLLFLASLRSTITSSAILGSYNPSIMLYLLLLIGVFIGCFIWWVKVIPSSLGLRKEMGKWKFEGTLGGDAITTKFRNSINDINQRITGVKTSAINTKNSALYGNETTARENRISYAASHNKFNLLSQADYEYAVSKNNNESLNKQLDELMKNKIEAENATLQHALSGNSKYVRAGKYKIAKFEAQINEINNKIKAGEKYKVIAQDQHLALKFKNYKQAKTETNQVKTEDKKEKKDGN